MARCGRLLIPFLVFAASLSAAQAEVELGTNVSDFEHFHNRGGGSVEHIQCIFAHLGHSVSIQRIPWRRARQDVASGKIDGFFTAISMAEVNKYATLSAPLVLENWYWYWRADGAAPDTWRNGAKLGVILGSHQGVWLESEGYPIHLRVGTLEQLVKLLLSGRIDAFIADRDHMKAMADALKLAPDHYQERFLRYVPLGVYFGNDFLEERPGFLRQFNRRIHNCPPEGFVMSADEQARIRAWLEPLITSWLDTEPLIEAVRTQNRLHAELVPGEIELLDRQWRQEFRSREYDLAATLLQRDLSRRLRELEVETDGRLTQIILADRRGLNVAISEMTSDYLQGDESKFLAAVTLEPGQLHFDPVSYGESTRRFQVSVSRPLFDPDSGQVIGVLIVGVDVEQALSLDY